MMQGLTKPITDEKERLFRFAIMIHYNVLRRRNIGRCGWNMASLQNGFNEVPAIFCHKKWSSVEVPTIFMSSPRSVDIVCERSWLFGWDCIVSRKVRMWLEKLTGFDLSHFFPHTRVGIHCSYTRGTGGAPQTQCFRDFRTPWRHRGYLWIEDDEERANVGASQRS